jgi:hypothetical protein
MGIQLRFSLKSKTLDDILYFMWEVNVELIYKGSK